MLVEAAVAPVVNGHKGMNTNILFDEGAQRSFISVQLATELQVRPTTTTQVALSLFGAELQTFQTLGVATIHVQTLLGENLSFDYYNNCYTFVRFLSPTLGLSAISKRLETCQSY